jgi:hypothetical protein
MNLRGDKTSPANGFADLYLERHAFYGRFIDVAPEPDTSIIVVIPCYNEPDIIDSVESLFYANRPSFPVEIIVVVNAPENASNESKEQNRRTVLKIREWCSNYNFPDFRVHVIDVDPFPARHAGAGFARKAGMDEAVRRFNLLNNENGIIVSFDADSVCDPNYFTELEKCLLVNKFNGCTIYFEHPLEGDAESEVIYEAVTLYELYLRFFVQALRLTGFPWAFHTIGSCFAVNVRVYAAQGGMNRRRAGEDFYFLHKLFPLGNFTELNTTRVVPSERASDRVPFGTGPAIKKYLKGDRALLRTYSLTTFLELSEVFDKVPDMYNKGEKELEEIIGQFPGCIGKFLYNHGFIGAIQEMNMHSAGLVTFRKRFFTWFNAFRVIKFLNYSRKFCHGDQLLYEVAGQLINSIHTDGCRDTKGLLFKYRNLQKETIWKC